MTTTRRGARAIPIFNSAPALYWNLQRAEIPGIDKLQTNQERLPHSGQAHTFAPLHTLKRQALRDGCLLDSGHRLEPLNHGFIESGGAVRRRVCRRWKIGRHCNYVVDSYAGIDLLKFCQALEQERRAADQHDGSRNFTDDDRPAHGCVRTRRSTCRLTQCVGQLAEGNPQGRKQTREYQDSHDGRRREAKDAQIHAEIGCKRQRCRHQRGRGMKQQCAQGNTRRASQKTQNQALGEQLPDQTATAGSQSSSKRHLLLPRCSFGQRQVRHVRAGDE